MGISHLRTCSLGVPAGGKDPLGGFREPQELLHQFQPNAPVGSGHQNAAELRHRALRYSSFLLVLGRPIQAAGVGLFASLHLFALGCDSATQKTRVGLGSMGTQVACIDGGDSWWKHVCAQQIQVLS